MLRSLINIITYKHRHKINLYQIQCKDLLNKVKVTRVRRIPKLDYNYSFKKFKFCNISPHNTFIKFDKKKNFKDITNLTVINLQTFQMSFVFVLLTSSVIHK